MGKTIISKRILGTNILIDVLFREIAFLGLEKNLNPDEIQKKVMECGSFPEINKILKENFGEEIKIIN